MEVRMVLKQEGEPVIVCPGAKSSDFQLITNSYTTLLLVSHLKFCWEQLLARIKSHTVLLRLPHVCMNFLTYNMFLFFLIVVALSFYVLKAHIMYFK